MLKVVSNTTPIISLLTIGQLELLHRLYEVVYIPQEVFNEIEAGKNKEFYTNLSSVGWLKIEQVKNPQALNYFLDLDKGEAEAIVLASELNADLIILDEILGRFHAKHAGLKITGTVGVLLKAKQRGFITNIKELLSELRIKGIWLSDKLVTEILKLANEE